MSKDLPSIDDFGADENLPSVEDFITEEKAEELPSVEDFIEKEEEVIEEATQTIEDADGNSFAEVKDIVPPWPELVRMINDVRSDIPDIPEVKYYDQELQDLAEQISKLPEVRYYDREVEAICEQIDAVREQVKDLPEVKYYDEQVDAIEDRIDSLQTDVANLPEVKYYDAEIEAICEAIDQVKASIPKFPKWVNEVNEVPDFSWIGKTFSVIDDDFVKVNDTIDTLRERVDYNLKELSEDIDKKKFEAKVELDTKSEEIETKIKEEKDKIWKEMRESSLRIWEYHKEFKDDDRKLKKQILGEYNSLKESIDKKVNEFNENSVKTDKLLLDYFEDLRNQISSLPEVKYYDKDIDYVKTDIKDLYKLVGDIKSSQKKLQEEQQLLSETNVQFGEDPPNTSNTDPLTPLDQNFVTLDQLQQHYKTFVQRVQYQLSSIGGGGAGFIRDLDDVTFDESTGENKLLIYNGTKWVGIASTALSGGSGGDADSASKLVLDVRNNNIGYALTIGTPVYQTAYNSGLDRLDVEESRASNSTTMPAKGVVSADLANNDNGQIIVYGELEGVNTQAFDVGDELFVASGGGLTNVRPTDPTHLVQKIAVVLKKSTANGAILVYGAGRTNDVPNNISIAGSVTAADGFFSGNVTIGGTVTYEDVKNVDSLGIVTARTGIDVLAGGINVTGVSTFVGDANFDNATLYVDSVNNRLGVGLNNPAVPLHVFGSYPTLKIQNSATAQYASASIDLQGPAGDERYTKILHGNSNTGGTETYFQIEQYDGSGSYVKQIAQYNYQNDYWNFLPAGTERLRVNTGGIDVTGHTETDTLNVTGVATFTGNVTATSFVGDGSQLTNVGAGTTIQWTLGADGSNTNYTFTGPGLTGAENDPTLYLMRGQTYKFINNMGAHPFRIQSDPNGSTGTQYNDGITNNDVSNGTLVWDVQFDAPKILYYQCTSHGNMGGPIYVLGEDEVSPSYTDVNVSGALTVSRGRIQADAASNLRFGNLAAGSGSNRNIAIGDQVLGSLSSGNGRNIGIGELSLNNVTSGGYNVVIGGYDGNSGNLDITGLSNRVVIADGEGNIRQYINNEGRTGINTTVLPDTLTVGGSVTATSYSGSGAGLTGLPAGQLTGALPALDGSALTGVSAVGSGIEVKDSGSAVGAAATVDFSTGLDVSPVSAGVVTVTASIPGISTTGTSGFNDITASGDVTVTGGIDVDGHTELDQVNITGYTTVSNTLKLTDLSLLRFGDDEDFGITFNGTNSFIGGNLDKGGDLFINTPNDGSGKVQIQRGTFFNKMATFNDGGSVDLYHNNALRLQTTIGGITVYGDVTLSGSGSEFTGSGAGLTSIPAGELTGTLPAIDGSALLNVNATGDGVVVEDSGSNVGSAKTINFDTGLDVTYSSGIATVTASGGSLQNRTTVSASTTSIADNAVGLVTVTGFKSYALMKVGLSTAGWIRIYTDSASRTADSSRSVGEDPAAGSGVIAEVVTTGISTEQKISPFTMGGNMDDPVDTTIYMAITNLSGSTQSINANLTILQLEA